MKRVSLIVVALAMGLALIASGCMQKGYEEGKEKRQDKADKMMDQAAE